MTLHEPLARPPSPFHHQPQHRHPHPRSSGQDSLNSMYTIETNQLARDHVALQMCKNHCQEYLHNVCELPSVEPTIRYLHGGAGFPTKATWLKAIRKGNYLS
jgi:hypothetical protein